MIVSASPIEAATSSGTNKISAARPITSARSGSASAARPTRATGARATISIIAIRMPSTDTRATVPARLSHRPTSPKRTDGHQPKLRRDHSPNDT